MKHISSILILALSLPVFTLSLPAVDSPCELSNDTWTESALMKRGLCQVVCLSFDTELSGGPRRRTNVGLVQVGHNCGKFPAADDNLVQNQIIPALRNHPNQQLCEEVARLALAFLVLYGPVVSLRAGM